MLYGIVRFSTTPASDSLKWNLLPKPVDPEPVAQDISSMIGYVI
jgi:hypothetical protein